MKKLFFLVSFFLIATIQIAHANLIPGTIQKTTINSPVMDCTHTMITGPNGLSNRWPVYSCTSSAWDQGGYGCKSYNTSTPYCAGSLSTNPNCSSSTSNYCNASCYETTSGVCYNSNRSSMCALTNHTGEGAGANGNASGAYGGGRTYSDIAGAINTQPWYYPTSCTNSTAAPCVPLDFGNGGGWSCSAASSNGGIGAVNSRSCVFTESCTNSTVVPVCGAYCPYSYSAIGGTATYNTTPGAANSISCSKTSDVSGSKTCGAYYTAPYISSYVMVDDVTDKLNQLFNFPEVNTTLTNQFTNSCKVSAFGNRYTAPTPQSFACERGGTVTSYPSGAANGSCYNGTTVNYAINSFTQSTGVTSTSTPAGTGFSCKVDGLSAVADNAGPTITLNGVASVFDGDINNWCNYKKYTSGSYGPGSLLTGCEYYNRGAGGSPDLLKGLSLKVSDPSGISEVSISIGKCSATYTYGTAASYVNVNNISPNGPKALFKNLTFLYGSPSGSVTYNGQTINVTDGAFNLNGVSGQIDSNGNYSLSNGTTGNITLVPGVTGYNVDGQGGGAVGPPDSTDDPGIFTPPLLQKFGVGRLDACLVEGKNYITVTARDQARSGVDGITFVGNTTVIDMSAGGQFLKIDNTSPAIGLSGDASKIAESNATANMFVGPVTIEPSSSQWKNFNITGGLKSTDPFGADSGVQPPTCTVYTGTGYACTTSASKGPKPSAAGVVWTAPMGVDPTTGKFTGFMCDGLGPIPSTASCDWSCATGYTFDSTSNSCVVSTNLFILFAEGTPNAAGNIAAKLTSDPANSRGLLKSKNAGACSAPFDPSTSRWFNFKYQPLATYNFPTAPTGPFQIIENGTSSCVLPPPPPPVFTWSWYGGTWGACAGACGTNGTRTRSVVCKRSDGMTDVDSKCAGAKPNTSESCATPICVIGDDNCPAGDFSGNPKDGICMNVCTAGGMVPCIAGPIVSGPASSACLEKDVVESSNDMCAGYAYGNANLQLVYPNGKGSPGEWWQSNIPGQGTNIYSSCSSRVVKYKSTSVIAALPYCDTNIMGTWTRSSVGNYSISGNRLFASCSNSSVQVGTSYASNNALPTPCYSDSGNAIYWKSSTATPAAVCGSANGIATTAAPTSGFCAVGSPQNANVLNRGSVWTWACANFGGTPVECSAPIGSTPVTGYIWETGVTPGCLPNTTTFLGDSFTGYESYLGKSCVILGGTMRAGARDFYGSCPVGQQGIMTLVCKNPI